MPNRKNPQSDMPVKTDQLEHETTQMSLINEIGRGRPSGRKSKDIKEMGTTNQAGSGKQHQ